MENSVENPLLSKEYSIPLQMFGDAFLKFQKKYVYPKNYILMLIYFAIIIWQLVLLFDDVSSPIPFAVIGLCAALIFVSWFNPKKIRRNLLNSIKDIESDVYSFKLFDGYVSLLAQTKDDVAEIFNADEDADTKSPNDGNFSFDDIPDDNLSDCATILNFQNKFFSITEYPQFYILYQSKIMFYVLPKFCFSADEILILNQHFKIVLNNRFSQSS